MSSFTGPGTPSVQIRTSYAGEGISNELSGYGRGTTTAGKAGAKVTPGGRSLGFHEGSHGLNYVEFLETHPPPPFTGTVGMLIPQFENAMTAWKDKANDYMSEMGGFSRTETDCVGTTIDEFNQANEKTGAKYTLVCVT